MNNKHVSLEIIMILSVLLLLSAVSPMFLEARSGIVKAYLPHIETNVSRFPAFLQIIEDEAFSETLINTAIFGENLLYLGNNVFFRADRLTNVFIPEKTKRIGTNAFPMNALIHGVEGSYAQKWAKENGFEFVPDDVWNIRAAADGVHIELLLIILCSIISVDIRILARPRRRAEIFIKSMRQQDRPELYPINYKFP